MMQRKLTYFFVIVIMGFIMQSCHDVRKNHYDDGTLESELTYQNDALNGKSSWFYPGGQEKYVCNYKNNLLEGEAIRWFENGGKQSIENYVTGMKDGISVSWDIDGNKIREAMYENDTLQGPYKEWFSNGTIMIEGNYESGLYEGTWTYRNALGMLIGKGGFSGGSGLLTSWYPNNNLQRKTLYLHNKKHGKEVWFDQDGDTSRIVTFVNGEKSHEEIRDYGE